MTSQWIQSGGGPLILLPTELLESWGGARNEDYLRACGVIDEISEIRVGSGVGLVLGDEPHQTSWLADADGGMLVRWAYADDERDVWTAVGGIAVSDFDRSEELSVTIGDLGGCVLLDSADPGNALRSEHLEVALRAGTYSVRTAHFDPNRSTRVLVHRLKRM